MRPLVKMILVSLMIVILSSVAYARRATSDIESLRGLKGVYVLVESLDPVIETDGLREDSIQTDVELKLRLAGIKVLTKEECFKEPGSPYLYIEVGSIKRESGLYAYRVDVSLKQKVFLARDPKIIAQGETWDSCALIGTVGEQKVDNIRDDVKDKVDEFINDYLSVNPKQ